MRDPERLTEPFIDIAEALWKHPPGLHGYEIKKLTKRSGPTVYNNLDRLRELGWSDNQWDTRNPRPGRPPRRIHQLTPQGRAKVHELLVRVGRIKQREQNSGHLGMAGGLGGDQ
ncbi:helix-turn-helix transcriptional regulator [Actinomadura sp. 9N215]|uniref:helix-turn-helix transcriptional regulator n=1 Tax=Actinomadura sp. 9N215 TaxID=3375150 RepID=UPI0037A40516